MEEMKSETGLRSPRQVLGCNRIIAWMIIMIILAFKNKIFNNSLQSSQEKSCGLVVVSLLYAVHANISPINTNKWLPTNESASKLC